MSTTATSIAQMANSVHVKEVLSVQLNTEFLSHNFSLLKQCLLKIHDIEGSLSRIDALDGRMTEAEKGITSQQEAFKENSRKIQELSSNVGDDFMKKMYAIEEKTKDMFSFEDTVSRLQARDIFMTSEAFKQIEGKIQAEIEDVKKIKDEFERYVPNSIFNEFKVRQSALLEKQDRQIEKLREEGRKVEQEMLGLEDRLQKAKEETGQNTKLIKEINFPELLEKNKKFREQMDQKMNDLAIKMKKKVGSNELVAFEQTMVEKLDKFLSDAEKSKAEKNATKDALMFLEKRIAQIEEFISSQSAEDDKDGLFTTKKIHCASCTKDLGKYQGKLGQYKPWSVFPCKELDPEKTGGFGYMSYLDKVQIKKGSEDQTYQRMNRTAMDKERGQSPRRGSSTARASNLISNFGSEEKTSPSLKDTYYRDLKTEKGDRTNSKFFRVKKETSKAMVSELDRSNLT